MSDLQASPNATLGAVTEHTAVTPLDTTIAEKMSAMLAQRDAQRKLSPQTDEPATGTAAEASTEPVVPDDSESIVEPEDSSEESYVEPATEESEAPEEVSPESTAEELIDFVDFARENPNAKFKFTRNGKEVVIDAKKAAAILGQGSAIHEEARELKIQRAEFEEYQREQRERQEGLSLAMEFTVQPRLKKVYAEIAKTQGYQATFQQQLQQTQDPAEQARIRAAIEQNEQYIAQQANVARELQPKINEFKELRKKQVAEVIEQSRKSFKDKELKNSYVYNEIREKVAKDWPEAKGQLLPGIDNIDLVTSDEHILSLIRDGLKYRDKPKTTTAGASIAALTGKKGTTAAPAPKKDNLQQLREQANKGDKKAADNLLMARLNAIRGIRR